jgi:transcription antitermination factor NusG
MNAGNKHTINEHEPRWFAVYVRYKREKLVQQRLAEKSIQTYLPLQKLTRRYTRKVRVVELPLISCYIFTRITKKEYIRVLETPDVVNFVRLANSLVAIPDNEINLVQRILGEGFEVEAEPSRYHLGDEVEIIGGNLTGIKGILLKQANNKNFLIELNHTGYALRMQVDQNLLRKIKSVLKSA